MDTIASLYHPLTATRYTQHTFTLGPFTVEVYGPQGDAMLIWPVPQSGGLMSVEVPFPDAKSALDWVRWRLFGEWVCRVSQIGAWFVEKYRTQARAQPADPLGRYYTQVNHAHMNMKKQGLPLELREFVLAGA